MKDTREITGLNVFSIEEGRILGRVAECVVDLATGKVVGLVVDAGRGVERGVARADITAIGKDAVMVPSEKVMKSVAEVTGLEDHRTAGKAPRVLTRTGQVLGTLGSVHVDDLCQEVQSYEIVDDMIQVLAEGPATLGIIEGTVHGRDAIVLPENAAQAIKRPGGLRAKLEKAFGAVREKASEVSDKLAGAAKKARTVTEEAGEKALAKAKEAGKVVEKRVETLTAKAKPGKTMAKKEPAKAKKATPKKTPGKKAPAKKAPAKKAPSES